ncbi:integrase, catalytic region, zinc finger, CCHC-type containing protein [Tanacetum coccineum]
MNSPNGDALRKCLLEGPYKLTTVIIPVVHATDDSPEVPERTAVETLLNMSPENKAHYESEKEAIHLLLTGIRDEIYSIVDACKTAHDMWIAIERLQQDPYYQAPKSHKPYAPPSKQSSSTRSNASTKYKGKEIAKPITPPSESAFEEDNLQTYQQQPQNFFKLQNKNVDTSPRYKNDNQTGQFRNQRTVTVAGARETVGSQVVQQTGIQCFNCKEFGHFAKECRKPKWEKDSTYHKEKMLLCKQADKGVPLQAEQAD